jgi:DNA-binding FadR family transcriptional regulator
VEGHIHIRMGSGVYVSAAGKQAKEKPPVPDAHGPFEILQARCIIESAIAEEAARLATPECIAKLDDIIERMAGALDSSPQALNFDRAFHTAIADIIGNSALNRFTGLIYDERSLSPFFEKLASYFEGPHTWNLAVQEHRAIRDAIAANDPEGAREAMRQHLTLSQKRFSESFGEETIGEE